MSIRGVGGPPVPPSSEGEVEVSGDVAPSGPAPAEAGPDRPSALGRVAQGARGVAFMGAGFGGLAAGLNTFSLAATVAVGGGIFGLAGAAVAAAAGAAALFLGVAGVVGGVALAVDAALTRR